MSILRLGFDMAKESWSMIQGEFTKENLKMMFDKDMGMKNTIIITFILVISAKVKPMVKDSTHGRMVSITKENGTWAKNMDLENGREKVGRLISEIGEKEKLMGLELTPGKTETFMKGIGWTA